MKLSRFNRLSSERQKEQIHQRGGMSFSISGLSGDVTHSGCHSGGPWPLTIYANVLLCFMVYLFLIFDWKVVIQAEKEAISTKLIILEVAC